MNFTKFSEFSKLKTKHPLDHTKKLVTILISIVLIKSFTCFAEETTLFQIQAEPSSATIIKDNSLNSNNKDGSSKIENTENVNKGEKGEKGEKKVDPPVNTQIIKNNSVDFISTSNPDKMYLIKKEITSKMNIIGVKPQYEIPHAKTKVEIYTSSDPEKYTFDKLVATISNDDAINAFPFYYEHGFSIITETRGCCATRDTYTFYNAQTGKNLFSYDTYQSDKEPFVLKDLPATYLFAFQTSSSTGVEILKSEDGDLGYLLLATPQKLLQKIRLSSKLTIGHGYIEKPIVNIEKEKLIKLNFKGLKMVITIPISFKGNQQEPSFEMRKMKFNRGKITWKSADIEPSK